MIADPVIQHQLHTTDGIFTRGYQLGYVIAKCESRQGFSLDALSSQVTRLCEVLAKAGASVKLGESEERRFMVMWTPMEVEFR